MTTQARELAKLVTNAGDVNLGDDIALASDGAILNFGANNDVTLTHVHNTALLLNSTRQLQFGDSGTHISQSADGVLDLVSDTEIEINATTIDINGNAEISGTLGVGGAITGDLTGTASLATTSTITANNTTDETVFPVFVDGATGTQGLETDTGFTYNPSTNTLGVVNLTVSGTNTIVNSVTMNANNAVIFEGATANAHETTLTSVDATGDRTVSLPDATGTLSLIAGTETLTNKTLTSPVISTITGSTITLDSAGDIILDADGGDIRFKDDGTEIGVFENSSSDLQIKASVQDKDIIFRGNDNGSGINALTLDMSEAGQALFNSHIVIANDSGRIKLGAGGDLLIFHDGSHNYFKAASGDQDLIFQGVDGSSAITALTLDMSDAGKATFNGNVTAPTGTFSGLVTTGAVTLGSGGVLTQTVASGGGDFYSITHTGNEAWSFGARSGSGSDDYIDVGIAGGTRVMSWHEDGKVGIGQTVPAGKLHVDGLTSSVATILEGNGTGDQIPLLFRTKSDNGNVTNYGIFGNAGAASANNNIHMGPTNTSGVTVDASGLVGIGNQTPSAFHAGANNLVVGTGSGSEGITIYGGAESNIFFADGSGGGAANLIGRIEYSHGNEAMFFYSGGLAAFKINGNGQFGMGQGSGGLAGSIIISNDGVTGTISNAHYNTGLGWEVFDDLTSGDSNTVMGNQAGYKLTEATGNTLIGRLAGELLTTGNYNVAVGFNTMGDAVVTGASNTAVGNSTMVSVTSGTGNTAIGEAASQALTTGQNNIAVGRSAMVTGITTGNYNIALGYEAGKAITSGGENILIGRDAGHDITGGNQSVAIGHESLTKNVSAAGNVAVGFQAGEACTGAENTFIGNKAGEVQEGGTYNVFIGSLTRGTHPSHSQAIAIGRDIDAAPGEVAIGTSSLGKIYADFDNDHDWAGGSDVRLKQNITDSTLGLNFINDLRTVTYNWKPNNELPKEWSMYREENEKNTDILLTGLIAQEVKEAIDESGVERFGGWNEDREGIQQIATAKFVFPLIKAIQELTAKLEAAEARLNTLEG